MILSEIRQISDPKAVRKVSRRESVSEREGDIEGRRRGLALQFSRAFYDKVNPCFIRSSTYSILILQPGLISFSVYFPLQWAQALRAEVAQSGGQVTERERVRSRKVGQSRGKFARFITVHQYLQTATALKGSSSGSGEC